MNKIISVKGGIVWGWVIRRKFDRFGVVWENDAFYKVVPINGVTVDFDYYNNLIKHNKTLLVPKSFTVL